MTFYPMKTGSAFRERFASEASVRRSFAALAAALLVAGFATAAEAQFSGQEGEGLPFDPFPRPGSGPSSGLPNPVDNITIDLPGSGSATRVLNRVNRLGNRLTASARACSGASGDVGRYLSCITDALNDFSAELDRIASQLPPGMRNVARIIDRASADISGLRADANRRLAQATTDAEREQIRRETLAAAAQTLSGTASEIRKTISLIRASDPELVAVQRETVFTVAEAVDSVSTELSRAIGL